MGNNETIFLKGLSLLRFLLLALLLIGTKSFFLSLILLSVVLAGLVLVLLFLDVTDGKAANDFFDVIAAGALVFVIDVDIIGDNKATEEGEDGEEDEAKFLGDNDTSDDDCFNTPLVGDDNNEVIVDDDDAFLLSVVLLTLLINDGLFEESSDD
jgi:hypothetical protein